jgi:hypothetical protein
VTGVQTCALPISLWNDFYLSVDLNAWWDISLPLGKIILHGLGTVSLWNT